MVPPRFEGVGSVTRAPRRVWLVGGTRPEALKLAPLVRAMTDGGRLRPVVVSTGQHPTMFHQGLAAFGLAPDLDLQFDRAGGGQAELAARLAEGLDAALLADLPAAVVVQGDTTTALVGAMAGFWREVPVVHLEAGLRSNDLSAPYPEEGNRRMIGQIAALHLAPTPAAAANLAAGGLGGPRVLVTGNTVVDAISTVANEPWEPHDVVLRDLRERMDRGARVVLVTVHRRESWGKPMEEVLSAVEDLLEWHDDIEIVLPVHPNPVVRDAVLQRLGGRSRVALTSPLNYRDLAGVLSRSTLVLSDSGGIQEEAPTFGVPVLVLRDVTERMEAVEAGCALLVGTERDLITATASNLLVDQSARSRLMSRGNPFGDGAAAARAEKAIAWLVGLQDERPSELRSAVSGPTFVEA